MKTPIDIKEAVFRESLVPICTAIKNSMVMGESVISKASELEAVINNIFDEKVCTSVIFTYNTDKLLFGVRVNPIITDNDVLKIIIDDTPIDQGFKNYNIEIDLNLFNYMSGLDVAAYIIEEIASVTSAHTIEEVRHIIDCILVDEETSIEIRQSINYSQILIFGIKDTINKIASLLYKDEEAIGMNEYSEMLDNKDMLREIAGILKSNVFGEENVTATPNLSVLKWTLMIYKDVPTNYSMAKETLETAMDMTGSTLERREAEKTLNCIKKAYYEVISEAVVEEAVKGFSLFKGLKMNGLRSIEDDLYEYKIRVKNCEDQEEAMYTLRQINTRIAILEDYLSNTEVSESERERWMNVIMCFRELRSELAKRKIANKKSYGIFVDYDKIDQINN